MNSFEKGKSFEQLVASMVRRKIDKGARRNNGSHANWHRRSDIYTNLPIHLECKDHENIKIKEWFRQAEGASNFGETPVVAFKMEAEAGETIMATLKLDQLLDLFVEIADLKLEIEDLKTPIVSMPNIKTAIEASDTPKMITVEGVDKPIFINDHALKKEIKLCKNGHICTPGRDKCATKGCPYSSTYIKPKAKKGKADA